MPELNKTDIANHRFYKVEALKRDLHANNFKCILYRNYCFFFLLHMKSSEVNSVPKSNGHH